MNHDPQTFEPSLSARKPQLSGHEILSTLKPPPQFMQASFDTYIPDDRYPSQETARETLKLFIQPKQSSAKKSFFNFSKKQPAAAEQSPRAKKTNKPGVYLDGGFGVGKTHLLAAAWNRAGGRKYFGSFLEYTSLVGALGFSQAVEALSGAHLICIDEFELDDPGDTMMMTRIISELTASGTKFIATSNTPPNALGEGRFAAEDFLREIQAMGDKFLTIRIDGDDYRQRDLKGEASTLSEEAYRFAIADAVASGDRVTEDYFDRLVAHLGSVHPSAYSRLIKGVDLMGLKDVHELSNQTDALRFVALIDRVYDSQIPIKATGLSLTKIFPDEMLSGGYRKKYLRCMSRLNALTANEL